MKKLLRQLIIDFQEEPLPEVIPRYVTPPLRPTKLRKVWVYIGVRRCGKTYLMYQRMQQLLQAGLVKEKLCYINFEDDRLMQFSVENFQDLLEAYFELYPQFAHDPTVSFFFDEIHTVLHWEKFIRRLLDQERLQIYITGSSAKMLSKEIATHLRGRSIPTELYPLSCYEYLCYQQINLSKMSSKTQARVIHYSQYYLVQGGFPETLALTQQERNFLLQDYVNIAIYRDVIERHQIKNIHIVKLFMAHCLQNIAAPLSINKVFNHFKSLGLSLSKDSLYAYLTYFEDAYLLFSVPLYNYSSRKRQVNPAKIYCVDSGLIHAFSIKPHTEAASQLENTVFTELRRHRDKIFYYKTKTGKEIDFVTVNQNTTVTLYQVCVDISDGKTYQRELQALIEAQQELKVDHMYLITLNEEKVLKHDGKTIRIIPFWRFSIDMHGAEADA